MRQRVVIAIAAACRPQILIFSDHAQVAPKHDIPFLADCSGVMILRMTSLSSSLEILPLIFWPLKKMSPPEVGLMRQMARPMVAVSYTHLRR